MVVCTTMPFLFNLQRKKSQELQFEKLRLNLKELFYHVSVKDQSYLLLSFRGLNIGQGLGKPPKPYLKTSLISHNQLVLYVSRDINKNDLKAIIFNVFRCSQIGCNKQAHFLPLTLALGISQFIKTVQFFIDVI